MAIRSIKVSDLDGADGADVTVIIREHPAIQQAKALDVTDEQAARLIGRAVMNMVKVEIQWGNGGKQEILVNLADLDKWLGDPKKVLSDARFTRGRPPGYRPGNGH